MRKGVLLAAALVACSKADTPPADGAADSMAAAPGAQAAASPLASLVGTWEGRTMLTDTDSVTSTFRATLPADTAAWRLAFPTDTALAPIPGHVVAVGGDSVVVRWDPFDALMDPPRRTRVLVQSVLRSSDGKLVGTYTMRLASTPDSVVGRGRSEASRVQ
jgi:hypothetical protein